MRAELDERGCPCWAASLNSRDRQNGQLFIYASYAPYKPLIALARRRGAKFTLFATWGKIGGGSVFGFSCRVHLEGDGVVGHIVLSNVRKSGRRWKPRCACGRFFNTRQNASFCPMLRGGASLPLPYRLVEGVCFIPRLATRRNDL